MGCSVCSNERDYAIRQLNGINAGPEHLLQYVNHSWASRRNNRQPTLHHILDSKEARHIHHISSKEFKLLTTFSAFSRLLFQLVIMHIKTLVPELCYGAWGAAAK